MKSSNLFIGLGIGLLVGAAVGLYFASSEEEREEYVDEINSKVDKAKQKIGKVVDQGLEELEKASDKVTQVAQDTISRVKAHRI
jgi:gas vesicle protein